MIIVLISQMHGLYVQHRYYPISLQLNPQGKSNVTPLHLACQRGNVDVVLILLSQSGVIESNIQDTHGDTPLHQACRYGHKVIVEELLKDKLLSNRLLQDSSYARICFQIVKSASV